MGNKKGKYNVGDVVRIIRKNGDGVTAFGIIGTVVELASEERHTTRPICVMPHDKYNGVGALWWKEKELQHVSDKCPDEKKAKASPMSLDEQMDLMGLSNYPKKSCLLL